MSSRIRRCAAAAALVLSFLALTASARAFEAHGSARQVYATGLAGHAKASLLDRRGKAVQTKRADALGGLLFRGVKPGGGYRVRLGRHGARSGGLTVISDRSAPPSTSGYDQVLPKSGYGYLTTRDGTKLAVDVHPPSDITDVLPGGVHVPTTGAASPTLIEYSGYGYADPAGPQNGIALIANLMGFTVVDVNMRGTGCSGGAYDFFEPLQSLDGYDVVETVARQPWVLHHKVGMMGISYGGISQLFTAQTNPPSLAAISPLSVIDQTQTTLYPGGVLNTGFAVNWAKERIHDALPASSKGGQAYAYKRIQGGDQTCQANQTLHGEAVNLLKKIRANNHYRASVADPLAPLTFVKKIKAPVFLACQFTDEQTGGHCPTLARNFTATKRKWFTFTNGTHIDSLDPATLNRWYDFLQLYVAQQAPITNSAQIRAGAPLIYQQAMNISGVTLPPDPIQQQPTYAGALAAFDALPSVRILFDNGAGSQPGHPLPGYETSYPSFPVPGTKGALVLPRQRRHARIGQAEARRRGRLHVERPRPSADRLHGGDRREHVDRAVDGDAAVRLEAAAEGQRGVLPDQAADREHDGRRRRLGAGVGPLLQAERRPPGDDQRGPPGRQGDLRAGRLAARERAQARREEEHRARARAEPPRARCARTSARPLRQGHDPALLRGPCLPDRLADPRDAHRAQRRSADLGLFGDLAEVEGDRLDRAFAEATVAAAAPGGAGCEHPHGPPAVPRAAGRALPQLSADRQSPGTLSETGCGRRGQLDRLRRR